MRSILYLLPDLQYRGHARQAALLAPGIRRHFFSPSTFITKGPGPLAEPLRKAGIPVLGHGGQRPFDLENWLALRRLLAADRPELLHVWGLPALGFLWYATLGKRASLPPLIVSLSAASLKKERLRFWDRWLLRNVRTFVVTCEAERAALVAAGLPANILRVVRFGHGKTAFSSYKKLPLQLRKMFNWIVLPI